jgi:hypothetical protein
MNDETKKRAEEKIKGYLDEYNEKQKEKEKNPFPQWFPPPFPINNPDPPPKLKDSTPVNRNTGEAITTDPKPKPAKEDPKVGTPGGGGSQCVYPAYHPSNQARFTEVSTKQDATNTTLGVVSNVQQTVTNVGIESIKGKIGTGIAGKASTLFEAIDNVSTFTEKFAKATRLDKVYNALTGYQLKAGHLMG